MYATLTANIMASMVSRYPQEGWAQEGGDPCLPASWSWVQCSSEASPRVFSMYDNHVNCTFNFWPTLMKKYLAPNIFFFLQHIVGEEHYRKYPSGTDKVIRAG